MAIHRDLLDGPWSPFRVSGAGGSETIHDILVVQADSTPATV
jgi:hypothetical protein